MSNATLGFGDDLTTSYFPPVGRFHLAGFNYDSAEAYAILYCTPTDRLNDRVSTMNEQRFIDMKCDYQQLAGLCELLPDGEELDYLIAVHDAVEGLNSINMGIRESYLCAQTPAMYEQFNDVINHGLEYKKELDDALKRIMAFDTGETKKIKREFRLFP